MANLITLLRLCLLFVIVIISFTASPAVQLVNIALLIIMICLDGVDGMVARARGEVSPFGSVFDIAADRVIELILWVVFAYCQIIPLWVPIVVITRGILVDSFRNSKITPGGSPFAMMQTRLGKVLVGGRFMRGLFGTLKLITFSWLLFIKPFPALWPQAWCAHQSGLYVISMILVYFTVAICLLRGIPVLLEVFFIHLAKVKK